MAMILIDKDILDKESSILYIIKKHRRNDIKGDPKKFLNINVLANNLSPDERGKPLEVKKRQRLPVWKVAGLLQSTNACFMDLQMPEIDGKLIESAVENEGQEEVNRREDG